MEMIIVLLSILQTIAISLGVGCSTVAIVSFFVAFSDGQISPDERKMLGVTYILLRIAMITILVTTLLLTLTGSAGGTFNEYLSTFAVSRWVLIGVLFGNSYLMTKHIMPSNFGPAIQAGSWYTLGITLSLVPLELAHYSLINFLVGYVATLALTIAIVNGVMGYLKHSHT